MAAMPDESHDLSNEDDLTDRIMANPRVQAAFGRTADKLRSGDALIPATNEEYESVFELL